MTEVTLADGTVLKVGGRYRFTNTEGNHYDGVWVVEYLSQSERGLYIGAHESPRPNIRLRSGWGQYAKVLAGASVKVLTPFRREGG
jgi:hypothetical protein